MLVGNEEIDTRTSDVPYIKTFQILKRHIDFTTYDLSEKCGIRLVQDTITLNKTMQNFLHSVIIIFGRRYHTGRVFTRKTLQG